MPGKFFRSTWFILSLFLFLLHATCFASHTVVLALSIPLETEKEQKLVLQLKELFLQDWKETHHSLGIVINPTQFEVFSALNSGDTRAFFWVSHSQLSQCNVPGFTSGKILNSHGIDITPLFNSIHPAVQFLGLISCDSETTLTHSALKSLPKRNPGLSIYTSKTLIDAKQGLSQSIVQAKEALEKSSLRPTTEKKDTPTVLQVRRIIPENQSEAPEVRIQHQGQVWGVLPEGRGGDIQLLDISVPDDVPATKIHHLLVISGINPFSKKGVETNLGWFELTLEPGPTHFELLNLNPKNPEKTSQYFERVP